MLIYTRVSSVALSSLCFRRENERAFRGVECEAYSRGDQTKKKRKKETVDAGGLGGEETAGEK